jgi:hypothetical protein
VRAERPAAGDLDRIALMGRATIAATVVEMADGRLALLVEMDPDPGPGPVVIDPVGDDPALAGRDEPGGGR